MNKIYVLFNPQAGNNDCEAKVKNLEAFYQNKEPVYQDITGIRDYSAFVAELDEDDELLICGGDGTLNRFVNDTYDG